MTNFSLSLIDVEELNNEQIAEKIKRIARENIEDIELLYASGMPEEIQGMTLGTQGIVLGPAAIKSLSTLIEVLKHELQP
jgi:hypothetical protein